MTDTTDITYDILQSGHITIFAPIDATLNSTNVQSLSLADKKGFLRYHMIDSVLYSTDFPTSGNYTTLQGTQIQITKNNGVFYVNGQKIITKDVLMRNGVLHVIDGLYQPVTGDGSTPIVKTNGNNPSAPPYDYSNTKDASRSGRNFNLEMFIVFLVTLFLYL